MTRTNLRRSFVTQELDGKFVVVDRQLWEQQSPVAMLSLVGSSMLAGIFETAKEANAERDRLNAALAEGATD